MKNTINTNIFEFYDNLLQQTLVYKLPTSVILDFPTGSGKTYNAIKIAFNNINKRDRILYLTPLRAVAIEVYYKFSKAYEDVALKIGGLTQNYSQNTKLLIATPEAVFDLFSNFKKNFKEISKYKIVIIDEIHTLKQLERGFVLEILLSRIIRLNPFVKFIGLSATFGKSTNVAKWLNAVVLHSSKRIIPLNINVLTYNKNQKESILLSTLKDSLSTLIFVHSRKKAENLAFILNGNGIKTDFHHAGLTFQEKTLKEQKLINDEISVIVATPTLESGINLPVTRVILYDLYYVKNDQPILIETSTAWQRLGRAGRPLYDTEGKGIIMMSSKDQNALKIMYPNFEEIRSSNTKNKVDFFILTEINHKFSTTKDALIRAWNTTLASFFLPQPDFEKILNKLINEGYIYKKNQKYHPTAITFSALRYHIDPYLFKKLIFIATQPFTPADLIVLAATLLKNKPKIDNSDMKNIINTLNNYNFQLLENTPIINKLKVLNITFSSILESIKVFYLIQKNTNTVYEKEDFSFYREELNGIIRLFTSITKLSNIKIHSNYIINIKKAETFLNGIPMESSELCLIKGIGIKRAEKLIKNGIKNLKKLSVSDYSFLKSLGFPEQVCKTSPSLAKLYFEKIKNQNSSFFFDDTNCKNLDIYRFERALDLTVSISNKQTYKVLGGFNSHIVQNNTCDCYDYKNGNLCKHIIATSLYKSDINTKNPFNAFFKLIRDCKILK